MSVPSSRSADQQYLALARFNQRLKAHIVTLLNDDLIAEHKAKPLGQHSDALERVLNYFRRPPRFGLYSKTPCREFQLIGLPVAPGAPPEPLNDTVYTNKNEALHAVFLQHVEALRASEGGT